MTDLQDQTDERSEVESAGTSQRRHWLITSLIMIGAVVIIAVLGYGLRLDTSKVPPANIDKPALDFRVSWIQGKDFVPKAANSDHFTLADLKGRPVVLNFWASWCVSCRQEAHELEKFWQGHKDKVLVVGIAIQDTAEDAKKFAAYFGKTYAIGLDDDGKAAIDYGVSGVPETFLIDSNGVIRHKEIGPVDAASLSQLVTKITEGHHED